MSILIKAHNKIRTLEYDRLGMPGEVVNVSSMISFLMLNCWPMDEVLIST